MKILLLFTLCCGVFASPIIKNTEQSPRFVLVPDSEGQLYLADLQAEIPVEPHFNADTDVFFLLFTRANQNVGQSIGLNADQIRASNWDSSRPTRFIIHGFTGGAFSSLNANIGAAYHRVGDFNVVVVDWNLGADTPNYITAVNRVSQVGDVLARFIDFLHLHGFVDFSKILITGHSLGAHVAGIAGKRVTRGRINTIIGMDPAGPLFTTGNPGGRFDIGDAEYTEGLHTNGGQQGFNGHLAHATFYPNFGRVQTGCAPDVGSSGCSHSRAHSLYAESIWNTFSATRCASFAEISNNQCTPTGAGRRMGGEPSNAGTGTEGVFWLETNGASPFSRG